MPEIIGVAFPIPKSFMARFFEDGKTVFIKPATLFKNLEKGMKFVFYQSKEDTGFIGEAKIENFVLADNPLSFYEIYDDSIFITKTELKGYLDNQKKRNKFYIKAKKPRGKEKLDRRDAQYRKWVAIQLDSIQKYDKPIKPKRFVPIGGQYIINEK